MWNYSIQNLADRSYNEYGLFIQKTSGNIIAKTQELLNNDCTETLDLPLFSVGVKSSYYLKSNIALNTQDNNVLFKRFAVYVSLFKFCFKAII